MDALYMVQPKPTCNVTVCMMHSAMAFGMSSLSADVVNFARSRAFYLLSGSRSITWPDLMDDVLRGTAPHANCALLPLCLPMQTSGPSLQRPHPMPAVQLGPFLHTWLHHIQRHASLMAICMQLRPFLNTWLQGTQSLGDSKPGHASSSMQTTSASTMMLLCNLYSLFAMECMQIAHRVSTTGHVIQIAMESM